MADQTMSDVVERLEELSAWLTANDTDMQMPDGMIDPADGGAEITRLRTELASERERGVAISGENDRLRAVLAQSDQPCAYCSLPAEQWAKCAAGFPGCSRADDAMGCPELGAAIERDALRARVETLEGALVEEREEVLWQAYGVGSERDGKWSHNFMSDGEWLVRECGMDPALGWYDAATVQAAIPAAARAALKEKNDA